jgi:hypothetical protein
MTDPGLARALSERLNVLSPEPIMNDAVELAEHSSASTAKMDLPKIMRAAEIVLTSTELYVLHAMHLDPSEPALDDIATTLRSTPSDVIRSFDTALKKLRIAIGVSAA